MRQRKSNRKSSAGSLLPWSKRKLWCFRLTAAITVPLLFLGFLEFGLRMGGFGYPAAFLLKSSNHGEETFVQNDQFGWRFFGARAARQPAAMSIAREKLPGTIRIFVFGESAAYGDPAPRFGLPRMLEAMLQLRYPDKKFEVVNAAMTGINSHVILPLARDCVKAQADVWVIYMGNNEVVGPFGAGTVFGGQSTPLPLIRAGLALKATRTGQLIDVLRRAAQKDTADDGSWEGMKAFINYKVAESDPRLEAVHENFARNLKDITAAGLNSGAKIVLSTVAVNLKDCAPFASLHRTDLDAFGSNEWQILFDAGVKAQAEGDFHRAATCFDNANQIDASFAEVHFRRGQCLLALQDTAAAQKEFAAARDLDALRFRCDSRLNDIIRERGNDHVALVDGERVLADASPDGIPGDDFFYEHVHLTFQGNYLLARAFAEKVVSVLNLPQSSPWPEMTQCAQRLAWTPRDQQIALSLILARLGEEPFTFQANHNEEVSRLTDAAKKLPPANASGSLHAARAAAEAALSRWPDDAEMWEQLAEIEARVGDFAGATTAVEHSLKLVPSRGPECWLLYGTLLAQQQKYEEAITAFKRVSPFYSRADWAGYNLALCEEKLGRPDKALVELKRVVGAKPRYGTGWLALGQLYEQMGQTNEAEQCYSTALTNRVNQPEDLARLARFCAGRRWFGPAVTNFAAAIQLSPTDPVLRMEAAAVLAEANQRNEAIQQYSAAADLAPDEIEPHEQLGFDFGRLGRPDLAEKEFRHVLRLDSNLPDTYVALGVALYEQKKFDEARQQFQTALQRNPTNETALRFARVLQNRTSAQ